MGSFLAVRSLHDAHLVKKLRGFLVGSGRRGSRGVGACLTGRGWRPRAAGRRRGLRPDGGRGHVDGGDFGDVRVAHVDALRGGGAVEIYKYITIGARQ